MKISLERWMIRVVNLVGFYEVPEELTKALEVLYERGCAESSAAEWVQKYLALKP